MNDDPEVLDAMYLKLFGKDLGLSEDVKWQAVTHKSFDHGRQPFNSKLRFLGMVLLPEAEQWDARQGRLQSFDALVLASDKC